ncbi:hypothetical protein JOC55_004310 [Paenibacillus sacheonensis]|nr:hypothetical protein [Paenibacillus sacheonensis]
MAVARAEAGLNEESAAAVFGWLASDAAESSG